ncbi:hypothetical protein D9M68_811800 [compost metagenome]
MYGIPKSSTEERSFSNSTTSRAVVLGMAMSALRGLLFERLTSSAADVIGEALFTAITMGKVPTRAIGSKSSAALNGSLLYRNWLSTWVALVPMVSV